MKFKFITSSDPYYQKELMLRWEEIEKPRGLPPGQEKSSEESNCYHLIALEKKQLIGCVVCHPLSETEGKIHHFAMSDEYKGRSFRRKMLAALEEFLAHKGISYVHVLAEEDMREVYANLGFSPEEEPYEFQGVSYQKMGKILLASA